MATASPTRTKMRIRKGDTVQVIAGKDKGKTCLLYTSDAADD